MGGIAGFGGGRSTILSALMWITFIATSLNWTILMIFYFVSQASEGAPISWYASPYWWIHLVATGIFAAATIDSVQAVSFIFKPSVAATVTMGIATIVDIVGGYFMIIDYWGQCIFTNGNGLDTLQRTGCSNERLYVWVVAIGAAIAILTAFLGFVFSLWDSAVRLIRSRQFAMASSGFQTLGERGQQIVGGILGKGGGTESTLEEPLGTVGGESTEEALYHSGRHHKGVYGKLRNQAYPTYANVPRYQHSGASIRRQHVIPRTPR